MWRLVGTTLLFAGCNALFGIHEIVPDGKTDPCTDVCQCKVDSDCSGLHTVCIDQVTSRTCSCAAGYTKADTGCTWSGVVDDPGFNQAAGAWAASGMSVLDPTAVIRDGMQDLGSAMLVTDDVCANPGMVIQTVTMPRRSRAEPLVLSATIEVTDQVSTRAAAPTIGLGSIWSAAQLTTSDRNFVTSRICLGAGQYAPESTTGPGGEVSLAVSLIAPAERRFCGLNESDVEVDRVEIVPADVQDHCPDPGPVVNGDAEGTNGWQFDRSGSAGATAGIVAGVGASGSNGVQLTTEQICDRATAILPISIPLADATGSPVLTLYHESSNTAFTVTLDRLQLPLSGGGSPTVDRYCIPAPLRGGTFLLTARQNTPAGTCGSIASLHAVIDNVAVANDPLCGTDPGVANPGFEAGGALFNTTVTPGKATVGVTSAPQVHSGQHALQLTVSDLCASATYQTLVATPAVRPGEGAAVTFWYKLAAGGSAFAVPVYKQAFVATRDGEWHQGIACLDPSRAGLPQEFPFQLSTTNGTCGAMAPQTVLIDDVAVLSSPMCPQ